jgi:superfamily II DNA or RNA helicase/HKD family nuclease
MSKLPSGIYEQVINSQIEEKIKRLSGNSIQIDTESLKNYETSVILSQYLTPVLKKSLEFYTDKSDISITEQIAYCNKIVDLLTTITQEDCLNQYKITDIGEILLSVTLDPLSNNTSSKPIRPITPLSQSSLFTGSSKEPSLVQEIKAEILSSDRIDLLISFIKWSGIRLLRNELEQFCKKGQLRIISTAYTGATDIRAIDFLSSLPNTEVRISYDVERTRLHAKAYYFQRDSGFSTAYIGSSNLSNPAITNGLEWNVKLTEKDSKGLIDKIQASFESYWNDPEFLRYDRQCFEDAIQKERGENIEGIPYFFDIVPFYYQKEILDRLQAERTIHNHYKNLIVAATGTGKTVISAFDFRRFRKTINPHARLLFVAHREEILKQSLYTFRAILKDPNFGDIGIRGKIPQQIDNIFISIQTFNSSAFISRKSPDYYDFIIIDEFHHAAAKSYQGLLSYYQPKILLGLTATPERMDNLDILGYFEGRIAAEIRLSEAIGRNLLAPFQYFGITDTVDLDEVAWSRRGGYDKDSLSKKYTGNVQRAEHIAASLRDYITDIDDVIGLGFCVSIEHATFMANIFTKFGIPSEHLSSDSSSEERNSIQRKLVNKEIHFIFVVDLYNEGVDIPDVNTILFLRPTESVTVFLQQLGRGLRLAEGKECLTVLDFVGRQNANYRFDIKYQALVSDARIPLSQQIKENTFALPRGCFITLEKVARETVLANLEKSLSKRNTLVQKISNFEEESGKPLTLRNFLSYHNLDLKEVYSKSSFRRLCADANLCDPPTVEEDETIKSTARKMLHLNSISFIRFIRHILSSQPIPSTEVEESQFKSFQNMLYYSLHSQPNPEFKYSDLNSSFLDILQKEWMVSEIDGLLSYLEEITDVLEETLNIGFESGISLHCTYNRDQIFAGLGHWTPRHISVSGKREGVLFIRDKKLDIFFITLNKSEKHFSLSTMYNDYAISDTLFHWQSQSTTSESSPTGHRYINHKKDGTKILLFVREFNKINNISQPFTCLGTASYVEHSGSKPMSILWKLDHPIPPGLMKQANKAIGG